MKTAKTAIMTGVNDPFEIREYPVLPPQAGMAKIKLIASGVCGTDIHIHKGKIPITLPAAIGHEFVGIVEEVSGEGISVGDNVIVDIACPCGECLLCLEGDDANCVNMGLTNAGDPNSPPHFYGGFGEYNYAPIKNLIKIPKELDPKTVSIFACAGPTALHSIRLGEQAGLDLKKVKTAVVQGLGPVGTFAALYLAVAGVEKVISVTLEADGLRDKPALDFGVSEVLYLKELGADGVVRYAREASGGLGVDLVFEASGSPAAVPQGMQMLRNRGIYLIPGQYSNSGNVEIAPQMITFNALRLIGSSQYSVSDVKTYLDFLLSHKQLLDKISSLATCYPLADINRAFDDAKVAKNIKTLIV